MLKTQPRLIDTFRGCKKENVSLNWLAGNLKFNFNNRFSKLQEELHNLNLSQNDEIISDISCSSFSLCT